MRLIKGTTDGGAGADGDFAVSGDMTVAGELAVTGEASFNSPISAPEAAIAGDLAVGGGADVDGLLTAGSVNVSGAVVIDHVMVNNDGGGESLFLRKSDDSGGADLECRSVKLDTGAEGGALFADGIKVLGAQGDAVANATGAGDVVARLNELLAVLRTHGLIAT